MGGCREGWSPMRVVVNRSLATVAAVIDYNVLSKCKVES